MLMALPVKESCFSLLLIHRGTLCWWGDRLEKRATKENWSVSVQMAPRCFGFFFLLIISLLSVSGFRVTGDSKVLKEKRG